MDLNIDNLETNSKLPGQLADNFRKIIGEDTSDDADRKRIDQKHNDNEQKLDQKYSEITNKLKERCTNLEEGEEKLDSDKASKVMLYKWWKELDDKFSACVDELDDKKASKKHVRKTFKSLSELIQQYHDEIVKLTNDNAKEMNDKAERIALGTDMTTVRQAVMQVLQEQGIISSNTGTPNIKDPDKAMSTAAQVTAITDNKDSREQATNSALAQLNLGKEE